MIGKSIAHYRITDKLGEGGMGEVYRATDDRLNREVAIKLLPESVEQDAARLARFKREAQLLAALNHPNIAGVYGLEEQDGRSAIILELVEGDTLEERIARGPLPIDDALEIARQIAEALETAHEKGIIHRDLKPANVKITPAGAVKVLDFGLAKALAPESDGSSSGSGPQMNLTASPTVTSAHTRDGMILGTAAYMSPEQARGKPVDRRADIWAFGAVLFEMLTGKTGFAGETISDTLVAILSREPELEALPTATPANVRALIERCLNKDARRRLRDIGEARVVLEDAIAGNTGVGGAAIASGSADAAAAVPGFSRLQLLVFALVVGAAMFAAGWYLRSSSSAESEPAPDLAMRRLTFDEGLEQEPTLSPDGNYVAYTTDHNGNLDIEILPLGGGDVTRVTTHAADDAQPRWSPDGTRLAFVSARDHPDGLLVSAGELGALSGFVSSVGGDLYVTPALGGVTTKLIDDGSYPTWSPDGTSLAFQSNRDGFWRIWRVPITGGDPVQLTTGEDYRYDYQPAWSPDGRWIAYGSQIGGNPVGSGLYVVPAEGGDPILVFDEVALAPSWSSDGKSIFFSASRASTFGVLNLWRIDIDKNGQAVSRPQRVTFGVDSDVYVSASQDGNRLAFATVQFAPDLWSLDVASGKLTELTHTSGAEDYPHLNPDGRRLLFMSDRTGQVGLWVMDLQTRELQQVMTPGPSNFPRWSPDGTRLAYQLAPSDQSTGRVAIQRWGDATPMKVEGEGGTRTTGVQWAPDGKRLAGSDTALWRIEPDGTSAELTNDGQFPTWSPDGKQIAYQLSKGQDRREIWAIAADGGEPRVVAGGDIHYSHPQWNPQNIDQILVVVDHRNLGIVSVSSGEMKLITDLESSTVLVDYPSWSFDGKTVYFSIARKRGDLYLIEEMQEDEAG